MKDLILIGMQGSGKGTQGKILSERFPFVIFETGSELRKLAAEDSDLGKTVKTITERGDLVSNELVMAIVENFISQVPIDRAVIFDGIPRSEEQRVSLETLLENADRTFHVLEIKLTQEEALNRLIKRGKCKECGMNMGGEVCPRCGSKHIERRADDNEASILKRLENFEKYTAPLTKIWESEGKLISVNGNQDLEFVTDAIFARLQD